MSQNNGKSSLSGPHSVGTGQLLLQEQALHQATGGGGAELKRLTDCLWLSSSSSLGSKPL